MSKQGTNSDFVLKLDSETWPGLYLSAPSLNDAIDSGKVNLEGNKRYRANIRYVRQVQSD